MERKYKRSRKRQNIKDTPDQAFMRALRRSCLSMLLCLFCVVSSTWAWFMASTESRVSVIKPEVPSTYIMSKSSIAIHPNEDGEYALPAGTHTIAVEPLTGTAPMYALIHIRKDGQSDDLPKQALADLNENEDEKWLPLLASDSNSIMVLESEQELEEFWDENAENESRTYEIIPFSSIAEGTYRVDWEPEDDRIVQLILEEDAYVSIEAYWLTEDSEDYPGLDEMMESHYIIVYLAENTSPSNPKMQTTAKTEKESSAAVGGSSESEEGSESADVIVSTSEEASVQDDESAATKESTDSKEETSETESEKETEESAVSQSGDSTGKEESSSEIVSSVTSSQDAVTSTEAKTTEEENSLSLDFTKETDEITPEMSTLDIEEMGEQV